MKNTAHPWTLRPNSTAVSLDDVVNDGQPQASPPHFLGCVLHPIEAIPDQVQLVFGNADALICDVDPNLLLFSAQRDGDLTLGVAKLDRIGEKIVDHLAQLLGIRLDGGQR